MQACHESKNGRTCYGTLYKCSNCGKVGCKENNCKGRQFNSNGVCLTCGKTYTMKVL